MIDIHGIKTPFYCFGLYDNPMAAIRNYVPL